MTRDEMIERALDEREAQGFPRTVTDPAVYERLALILGLEDAA